MKAWFKVGFGLYMGWHFAKSVDKIVGAAIAESDWYKKYKETEKED